MKGNLNHINEVHVIQLHPFNHVCHTGVAANAGSVHLIFSMDQKLVRPDERGYGTPATPINEMTTGSPQTIPLKPLGL